MKKICLMLLALIMSSLSVNYVSFANEKKVPVLISFKSKVNRDIVISRGGKIKDQFENLPVLAADVPKSAISELQKEKDVEFIEDDCIWSATSQSIPWGISRIGANLAQNKGFDGKGIKVGVIDSGISSHDDLAVVGGWNFIDNSLNYADDFGHGTHVAGTIAATDNNIGVIGAAPSVKLYALKVLDNHGNASWSNIAKSINWAIKNDLNIINMSFGGTTGSKTIEKALGKAYKKGIIIVGAAGNNGNDSPVIYPAKYDSVIAVGATDPVDNIAIFSDTGPEIEVVSPGVAINSTYPGNTYNVLSGTSMAAPHVTGTLALIWSKYPTLTNIQVREKLQSTAIDLGYKGFDNTYGYGLVSAKNAIK